MNLDISPDTFMRFLHGNDGLGVAEPLGLVDLKEIMVKVKDMNIVANAQANFEFNNARRLVKDPKTALRLFTSAEQKYLEVLSSNPNDIQTNLNLAETLRSKLLVKDCHRFESWSRNLDESDPDYKRAETAYRNVHPETRMGYKVGDDPYWRLMYGQFLWNSGGRMDRAEHQLLTCIQKAPACPRYIQVYATFLGELATLSEPQVAQELNRQCHLFSIRAQVMRILRSGVEVSKLKKTLKLSREDLWLSCHIDINPNGPPLPPPFGAEDQNQETGSTTKIPPPPPPPPPPPQHQGKFKLFRGNTSKGSVNPKEGKMEKPISMRKSIVDFIRKKSSIITSNDPSPPPIGTTSTSSTTNSRKGSGPSSISPSVQFIDSKTKQSPKSSPQQTPSQRTPPSPLNKSFSAGKPSRFASYDGLEAKTPPKSPLPNLRILQRSGSSTSSILSVFDSSDSTPQRRKRSATEKHASNIPKVKNLE